MEMETEEEGLELETEKQLRCGKSMEEMDILEEEEKCINLRVERIGYRICRKSSFM
jgi:hypothetical protein